MNTHFPRKALVAAAVVLGLGGAACSLILDSEKDQCATTADCDKLGVGLACVTGVCVASADSGLPGQDGALPDGASPDGGCTPKEPKVSSEDFLNETCTDSKCIPFDNCTRLGLCGGDASLPALMDPPDGGV